MLARDFSPVFLGKQSVDAVVSKVKPQFDKLLRRTILEQQSRRGEALAGRRNRAGERSPGRTANMKDWRPVSSCCRT